MFLVCQLIVWHSQVSPVFEWYLDWTRCVYYVVWGWNAYTCTLQQKQQFDWSIWYKTTFGTIPSWCRKQAASISKWQVHCTKQLETLATILLHFEGEAVNGLQHWQATLDLRVNLSACALDLGCYVYIPLQAELTALGVIGNWKVPSTNNRMPSKFRNNAAISWYMKASINKYCIYEYCIQHHQNETFAQENLPSSVLGVRSKYYIKCTGWSK